MKRAINLTYWNINNYKSKLLGNKLCDRDFLSECRNSDIIALVETHASSLDGLTIPGFEKPYVNISAIQSKHKKPYGGLAVFIKHELHNSKAISLIPRDNKDMI